MPFNSAFANPAFLARILAALGMPMPTATPVGGLPAGPLSTHIDAASDSTPPPAALLSRLRPSSTPPMTAAGSAPQDLTPAEMAGPVPRDSGGLTPTHIAILQALGLITPEDGLNLLGILGAALQGASALRAGGSGADSVPRAPTPPSGGGNLGKPYPQQPNAPIQAPQLPAILRGPWLNG
jgi:hypothetical protein